MYRLKKHTSLLLIVMLVLLISCEKEPKYICPLQVSTNKQVYKTNEQVVIVVTNYTDSIAVYMKHKTYNIYPVFLHYINDKWSGYKAEYVINGGIQNGELLPGSKVIDTLNTQFEKGIYRINYQIIMRPSSYPRNFYSNIFIVEE